MKDLTTAGAWTKTCRLIQEKYGKKLEFRFLNLVEGFEPSYSKGDDLIIPLKAYNHYLGDVVINRGSTLTLEERGEVVDLVKFLIEPQAYNLHLKRVEQTQSAQDSDSSQNNIVSLFRRDDDENVEVDSKRIPLSNIIHLRAISAMTRHKVALKIHDMSGAQFMTRLQDLSKSIHSIDDLINMGDLSIYIEDLKSLSPNETQLLEGFSKLTKTSNILFLIGSDMSEEQIHQSNLEASLKNDLLGFLFDIDRVPLAQQTSEDVLDLLFFSFEQQQS